MTRWSWLGIVLATLFLLPSLTGAAEAADPIARAQVETQGNIVAGQQVVFRVDVLVPNFFLSSPKFPQLDLPNAVVILQDDAQNLVETIDGTSYAGIRRIYLITPQSAGEYVLPQARVTFSYAAVPGQPPVDGSVDLPPTKFTVLGPPSPGPGQGGIVAAKVTVTQVLDRDLKGLKVGDAVVRTVTTTADGLQAMMIPPPEPTALDGVRTYEQDPTLTNEAAAGQGTATGRRVDRVTYTFERPGQFVLPPVAVGWYDPATGKHEEAKTPEIVVEIGNTPAFKPAIAPPPAAEQQGAPRVGWVRYVSEAVAACIALALIGWLAARLKTPVSAWREARRTARDQSEATFFKRFENACQSKDGLAAYTALDTWSRHAGVAPIDAWLEHVGDVSARQEYLCFEQIMFGLAKQEGSRNSRELLECISRARASWRKKRRSRTQPASALPELNPSQATV